MAIAASLVMSTAVQAQVKNVESLLKAVEKAKTAAENPKSAAKPATWIRYGETLVSAYDAPTGNAWVGMSRQEYQVMAGNERPQGTSEVQVSGQPMVKESYGYKDLYFNAAGQLAIIDVTKPVVEGALTKAVAAYAKAGETDVKGSKTKDICIALESIASKLSDEAFTAYSLGDSKKASALFEQAAAAAATAPLNKIDTNAVYNAGFTALNAGEYERAKTFFDQCLKIGYAGEDGDAYAKLAAISEKLGDKMASKAYLEEGFTKYPQSQSILVSLINYYLTAKEDTGRLFDLLDLAKKNEPNNASLYYVEGNIRSELGQIEEAVRAYDKCSAMDPSYEFGYIGKGILLYNRAVVIQDEAGKEMDDAKYTALMGEFETTLKSCIEPFEKAFEMTKDNEIKSSIAEYLKNACFRFRTESAEAQAKYDKYASYNK